MIIQHLLYITVPGTRNTEIYNITLNDDCLFTCLSIILEKNVQSTKEEVMAWSLPGGLEAGSFHGEEPF